MNDTERFDEWIRGEMDNLDDSPDHFRQADIWQKLQTELHPVPGKKSFFVTPEASNYRIAAALALLLLVGVIGWRIQSTATQTTVSQAISKLGNKPVLQAKQPLLTAKDDVLKEAVTPKKQVSLKKQSKEKPTEQNFVKVQNVDKVEIQMKTSTEIEKVVDIPVPVTEQSASPVVAKTTPKSKFKIVHSNELADYQKAELAEIREKEAKAKGVVVINWKANATNQSESSLMSYFKHKSSKAD